MCRRNLQLSKRLCYWWGFVFWEVRWDSLCIVEWMPKKWIWETNLLGWILFTPNHMCNFNPLSKKPMSQHILHKWQLVLNRDLLWWHLSEYNLKQQADLHPRFSDPHNHSHHRLDCLHHEKIQASLAIKKTLRVKRGDADEWWQWKPFRKWSIF